MVALACLTGVVYAIHGVLASKGKKQSRMVQVVQIIRPPPPPPELPPPPPPDQPKEEIPKEQPDPVQNDEPTPSDQLGLDSEGGAGSDAFGLAARKGGQDLLGSGGATFAWYTGRIKDVIADKLANDVRLRSHRYTVAVRVWVDRDGRIKDVRLVAGTGNHELDQAIVAAVSTIDRMSDPPPIEMPQPISLKIVSRI
jgi:TonB family protein